MSNQGWSADAFLKESGGVPLPAGSLLLRIAAPLALLLALAAYGLDWYSPLEFKWLGIALFGGAAFLVVGLRVRSGGIALDRIDAAVAILLAWVWLSLVWSPDRLGGIDTAIKFALLAAIFVAMRHARDEALDKLITGAAILAALASMVMERTGLAAYGGFFNPNYQTEMLLVALPFMLLAHRVFSRPALRWPAWAMAALTIVYLLGFNSSKIEFVVLPAMVFAVLLVLAWQRSRLLAGGTLALAVAVFALLAWLGWENGFGGLTASVKTSLLPRIELTLNTLLIWLEHPILGTGAGGFTATYPLFQTAHRDLLPFETGSSLLSQQGVIAAQAHNDIAQFLAVFGLVGAMIVLAAIWLVWKHRAVDLRDPTVQLGGLLVVGLLANGLIDFPFQNAATALASVIGLGWLLRARQADEISAIAPPALARMGLLVLLAALAIGSLFWGVRLYQGNAAFNTGARLHYAQPMESFGYMVKAVRMYPLSVNFRLQAYMSLIVWEDRTGERQPAHLHEEAFGVSLSAGPQAIALLPRLQHLYNKGQYSGEEVERWRTHLRKNAPDVANVWLQEALFELRNGNAAAVAAALERFEGLGGNATDYTRTLVENIRREAAELPAGE